MIGLLLIFGLWIMLGEVISSFAAIRMLMMDVPSPTNYGESVELICSYQLDGDKLYSVKWYKDDVEFFRYVPNDWPPGQFLPIQGVRVDLSKSGSQSVYLRHVDLNSAGVYRCEVSAEAPEFQTVEAEKEMKVLVLPTEGPRITGGLPKYKVGDIVLVNCTSSKSKPAANLEWYINDELITGKKESLYQLESATTFHLGGLESSSLSLKFRVNEQHFHKGNMKLKCTATISRVYTMSNEELVFRQQSSGLHIMENMSRVRNTSSKIFHTNMEQYTVIAYLMLNILGRLMPDFWTRILYPFIVQ